tara:strand:+ start:590 stop:1240 length:651 start_codon:yes stop_codon:yes gene_type:complete
MAKTISKTQQPTMLYFARDLPNICSLAGLVCAVLGIWQAILGNFPLAIIGILWAVLFDWADGIIARGMTQRTKHQRAFGGQLDSLIDMVSFGVFPAIFLLSYSGYNPWFLPGALLIVVASAIRLSYFNVFGMNADKTYTGLALDMNALILAYVYLFEGFIGHTIYSILLYILLVALLLLNLASIRTPKLAGNWFYVLIGYTVILTGIYTYIFLKNA